MPLLPILRFPDPRLKKIAAPVEKIDDGIRRLVRDMAETMYEAPGIGLAATQVDIHKRVIVIDASETKDQLLVLINAEITAHDGVQVVGAQRLDAAGGADGHEDRRLDHSMPRPQTTSARGCYGVC